MKALTVDFLLITQSMRDVARESSDYFLDKNTAKVISLSRALIRSLSKEGFEERQKVPAWDAQMIPIARKIVLDGSKDYVRIPESFGRPENKWRANFIENIGSPKLKERLTLALQGRGSVNRFKEIVDEHVDERHKWEEYRSECWKEKITKWLESIGIIAIEGKAHNKSGRPK